MVNARAEPVGAIDGSAVDGAGLAGAEPPAQPASRASAGSRPALLVGDGVDRGRELRVRIIGFIGESSGV